MCSLTYSFLIIIYFLLYTMGHLFGLRGKLENCSKSATVLFFFVLFLTIETESRWHDLTVFLQN